MNWNDYEALWKRQELPAGAGTDVAELRRTFEAKRRYFARTLQARDCLELVAGVFVSLVFARMWWRLGREGWPIGLAILLMLGLSGFFLRERWRTVRQRLGPEATLRAKLEAELAELHHQRRLLLNVARWYVAPCAVAVFLVAFALLQKAWHSVPADFFQKLSAHPWIVAAIGGYFLVILPLVFWGICALNRYAVRKTIDPRIAELEKLHQDLVSAE